MTILILKISNSKECFKVIHNRKNFAIWGILKIIVKSELTITFIPVPSY